MNMKPPYHDRLRDYDALHVQKLWEDSIELDIDLGDSDPFYAKEWFIAMCYTKEYRGYI